MTKFKEGDKVSWENPEPIFCKGDEVHHWREGKGTVGDPINHKIYMVQFCHRNKPVHESELSFTPYNLKDGGFSQERPEPCVYIVHYEGTIYGCFDTEEKAYEYRDQAAGTRVKKLEVK